MARLMVIGQGRIGKALAMAWRLKPEQHRSGREMAAASRLDALLGEVDTVIHVAGPAGNGACMAHPDGAFAVHYRLTERLAQWTVAEPLRRLIVVSTLAPDDGFYGPLKRAADRMAIRIIEPDPCERLGQVTIVQAGQVIGEGVGLSESPGVVARFIFEAVTQGTLAVPESAAVSIRLTPLSSLLQALDRLVHVEIVHPQAVAPASEPITVRELARMVMRLVKLTYEVEPVVVERPTTDDSYVEPTGVPLPVRPTAETLLAWLRTLEVKMLFAPRRRVR